jgi:hypothetical protein
VPATPISRTAPTYGKYGQPKTNWFQISFEFLEAWNSGKFSGEGQARLMLNLYAMQYGGDQIHQEVAISLPALKDKTGLSAETCFAQGSEIANRCGNLDPAWVKAKGKCEKDKCTCPKMLSITKRGNVNAYRINLANFASAPRYVAPKSPMAAVPSVPKNAKAEHEFKSLAPGSRSELPFLIPAESRLVFVNDETNALLAAKVVLSPGECIARIKFAAEVLVAHYNEHQANTVDSVILTEYRKYFTPTFVKLKKSLSDSFLLQIAEGAHYAPVSDFDDPIKDLQKRKLLTSGMILTIAKEDIGPTYLARVSDETTKTAKAATLKAETDRLAREQAFDTTGDETVWPTIRKALKAQVSEATFENWFARTRGEGASVKGGTLLVTVADEQTAAFLAEEYRNLVDRTAHAVDSSIERIQFRAAKTAGATS